MILSPLNRCSWDFKKVTELDLTLRNVLLLISSKAVNLLLHINPIRQISKKPTGASPRILLLPHIPSGVSALSEIIRFHQTALWYPEEDLGHFGLSSSWTSACLVCCRNSRSWRRGCRRRSLTAPQTEPSDRCLFLPGLTVYFHEGINVYFDMPLALF